MQTIGALAILGCAVAYLAWRFLTRRATGNCCGEPECPAASGMIERMRRDLR
jgi:hypothetical protein